MSPARIAELFLRTFPERIDFVDEAWKSLKSCESNGCVVWNALFSISTTLYELWSQGVLNLESEFNNRVSGFEFCKTEGRVTKRERKLMGARMVRYRGRIIDTTPHISKGNMRGKSKDAGIRVYFGFDRESGKIIIASIGEHRDNRSSRLLN